MPKSRHRLLVLSLLACAVLAAPSANAWWFNRDYKTKQAVYAETGNAELELTLFLPKKASKTPRPAVALFHGGAWIIGTRLQVRWYAKRLAEEGYVAATVDYRKLPKYAFPTCVYDAKAAIRWLRAHAEEYNIDPNRIAASGHSAGGHLAMMLGTTGHEKRFEGKANPGQDSSVQAVISVYGAVDLTVYETSSEELHLENISRKLLNTFVGEVDAKGKDPFAVASPVTYIDEHSAPTLFIQGSEDWMVPPSVSAKAEKLLEEAGVPTRRVLFEGVGHSFDQLAPKRRPEVLKEMLRFLKERL